MKKLIIFIMLVLFVSKADLGNVSIQLNKQLSNFSNYIKTNNTSNNQNKSKYTAKDLLDYIKDPKDIIIDYIDSDIDKLELKLNTLETTYYEQLLNEYKINKVELEKLISNAKQNDDIDLIKKDYIMKNTKLSEKEYYQVFIFPFNHIDKPTLSDDMSFSEIKDSYEEYLEDKIKYLESKINIK